MKKLRSNKALTHSLWPSNGRVQLSRNIAPLQLAFLLMNCYSSKHNSDATASEKTPRGQISPSPYQYVQSLSGRPGIVALVGGNSLYTQGRDLV